MRFKSGVATIAPVIPVMITSTAVRFGAPPIVSDTPSATGAVTEIGRGRHTSTQSVALPLASDGWVIDTPGIRSFGLAHIEPDDVVLAFSDLAEAIDDCPRGCGHMGPPADPEGALDELTGPAADRGGAARRLLAAMREG